MTTLKVINVGLHRTGSLSLKVALERLGLGPCYHGFEFVGRGSEDVNFWRTAIDNDGNLDWDALFSRYRSAADWPMVSYWDKVVAAYPDAKVVLTERDPEDWFESHAALFQTIARVVDQRGDPPGGPILTELVGRMFGDDLFNKAHCIDVFEHHYSLVRNRVPADRLLSYQVADGWDPLCRFLGIAPPVEPFPSVNGRDSTFANALLANSGVQSSSAWR